MMEKSYEVLKDHPVNQKRVERGLRPANSMCCGETARRCPCLPLKKSTV